MSAPTWPGILVGVLALSGVASAETYRHGRVLEAEPGVVLQGSGEAGSDEAVANMPFLPGDRVWTAGEGRVEFQFADGTLLRLDARSKLDYVSFDAERVVLRLWSGSAYVQTRHVRGSRPDVGLETPAAVIESRGRGLYRVDVRNGDTRVSVYEGDVDVEGDGDREALGAGERTFVHRGDAPERGERFEAGSSDPFDLWSQGRDTRTAWADTGSEYLPDDLDAYAGELDPYGRWVQEPEYGYVWVPVVQSTWAPYSQGRWVWSPYGWTWVPVERWGWVTSHYGRWDYRPHTGWCWIPRSGWSGAWVSWAANDRYVGWSPLGYHDRPVVIREQQPRHVGNAVPRWNVLPREELARGRAVAVARPPQHTFDDLKPLQGPMAQPDREARGVRTGHAVPRSVSTRPGPGDTVPELRTDPKYTIPFPTARRTPRDEPAPSAAPADSGSVRSGRPRETGAVRQHDAPPPTATGTSERTRAPRPAPVEAAPAPRPAPREESTPHARPRIDKGSDTSERSEGMPMAFFAAEEKPPTPKPRDRETDRDVLRRLFRPADQGRDREKAKKREGEARPPLVHQTPKPEERRTRSKKKDDDSDQ